VTADTSDRGLLPAGFGTLHQDDIAIALQLEGVLVKLFPLDESVIRVLAPDSYKSLHDILQSRQGQLAYDAALHNLRQRNVWYVSFYGLAPDAPFTPLDLTISAPGRDFHPLEVLGIRGDFGKNRLQVRDMQAALYLFDDGVPLNQPLTVSMGAVTNTNWQNILRRIESERAQVRARAAKAARGDRAHFL
jgi:hypothetical protein